MGQLHFFFTNCYANKVVTCIYNYVRIKISLQSLFFCCCFFLVEPSKAATGFREFLKTLKKPAAQDVNEKCKL